MKIILSVSNELRGSMTERENIFLKKIYKILETNEGASVNILATNMGISKHIEQKAEIDNRVISESINKRTPNEKSSETSFSNN